MKEIMARLLMLLYQVLGYILWPLLPFYLFYRARRDKEDKHRKYERLACIKQKRPAGPLIWMHAVSVGETAALIPLIKKIRSQKMQVLLTTETVTSARFAQNFFGDYILHQYAPFDVLPVVRRFLEHWQPDLSIVCESEIWPMRILELSKRGILQIIVNAHLSEKSYSSWKRYKNLARYIFQKFDLILCQTRQDAEKYSDLGALKIDVIGNLKAESLPPYNEDNLVKYRQAVKDRQCWAAISTHEQEEIIAAQVHNALKSRLPNLLTIIVPRHLERVEQIVLTLKGQGFTIAQKSKNDPITKDVDIFIGDTIGEMGLYLHLAPAIFIGKSLYKKGGHNPLEPALLAKALISGPYVENFSTIYTALQEQDAVLIVKNATELALQVNNLLTQPNFRKKMQKNAYEAAYNLGGALEKTMKALEPFFNSIVLDVRLNKSHKDKR